MPFCQHCGSQASDTTDFCYNCGADVTAAALALPAISDAWRTRFALLHKAGGAAMPQSIALSMAERAVVRFNVLAFVLGPIYYVAMGMWKKAVTLGLLALALIGVIQMLLAALNLSHSGLAAMAYLILPVTYAARANIDYFTRIVLHDDSWL
ncbi:hypothetical protein GCM10027277_40610 [Pseudoduganella ginsengisoli]|uniref:DUF2628 domain-containing protein n=1 Tax=Pseudoduganella ginsengisoli TaxID=1462440 RepID=A0A6L6PWQ5_9BURK|nr:zinc ribbon domain-containing protein [Pseudoduganella ginsengisoli]MTW01870.1 DUF2628 domain-containing protein [Pseudoduganella ginsengisoli]